MFLKRVRILLENSRRNSFVLIVYSTFAFYQLAVPARYAFRCPVNAIFGVYCPACGSTRAVHALMAGHFSAAFHDNALLFATPALLTLGLVVVRRKGEKMFYFGYLPILISLVVYFVIARNQPHSILAPIS
jgi:Protein of unknown function (DUF2752)